MTITALRKISRAQNGVGAFILQCKKMDFHYCEHGGSSDYMKSFLKNRLAEFAKANPSIEITVSPRPNKHPVITGHYINGREKAICVKKLDQNQIMQKVQLLRDANGEKLKKVTKPVTSYNGSVRGIWEQSKMGHPTI